MADARFYEARFVLKDFPLESRESGVDIVDVGYRLAVEPNGPGAFDDEAIALNLPRGISEADAKVVRDYLNEHIASVSCVRFGPEDDPPPPGQTGKPS